MFLKSLEGEPVLGVHTRVVIESVEEDQAVSHEKRLIFCVKIFRVLLHVDARKFLDDPLNLVTFTWQSESGQEFSDRLIYRHVLVVELRGKELQYLLIHILGAG